MQTITTSTSVNRRILIALKEKVGLTNCSLLVPLYLTRCQVLLQCLVICILLPSHLHTAVFSSAYCCLLICMLLSSHLHAAILDELSRHLAACAYLAVLGFDKLRSCFLQVACFTWIFFSSWVQEDGHGWSRIMFAVSQWCRMNQVWASLAVCTFEQVLQGYTFEIVIDVLTRFNTQFG